jgi:hypothetical protein
MSMTDQVKATTTEEATIVDPNEGIDFLSFDSLADRIKQLSKPVQDLFLVHDAELKASMKAEKSTVDYVFDLTGEGIPCHEVLETFEAMVKECGLWPLYLNVTTKLYEPVGQKRAAKTSLAGKIHNRIKALVGRKDLIKDEDGMAQFYDKDGTIIIKNEQNTDMDGDYTVGVGKGGKPSVFDNKKAKLAATQTRSVNPAEVKKLAEQAAKDAEEAEVQSNENARKKREQLDLIAQGYNNALKGLMATQKVHESHRASLSRSVTGKAYLEAMQGLFEKDIEALYDLADVLKITEKDGKLVVNL